MPQEEIDDLLRGRVGPYSYSKVPRTIYGLWGTWDNLIYQKQIYDVFVNGELEYYCSECASVAEAQNVAERLNERHFRIIRLSLSQGYKPVCI